MAIDTEAKRRGKVPPLWCLPSADGAISAPDRQHKGWKYAGILAGVVVIPDTTSPHALALIDLFEELYLCEGYQVSYSRGAVTASPIRVIKARQNEERFGQIDQGLYLTDQGNDFIVLASEFQTLTGYNTPQRLDRITWQSQEYVVGVDGIEDTYRNPHDLNVIWRIHSDKL